MAYSDYGGYAYRNGERVEERSDFVLTPDGKGFSSPGAWPGWAALSLGVDREEFKSLPMAHSALGDGPVTVMLYKQSSVDIYYGFDHVFSFYDTHEMATDGEATATVDGTTIEVVWEESDNFYVYVRLTHPDGTVWTGWSGYGVGAGLEDAGYGFNTREVDDTMRDLFPDEDN